MIVGGASYKALFLLQVLFVKAITTPGKVAIKVGFFCVVVLHVFVI